MHKRTIPPLKTNDNPELVDKRHPQSVIAPLKKRPEGWDGVATMRKSGWREGDRFAPGRKMVSRPGTPWAAMARAVSVQPLISKELNP